MSEKATIGYYKGAGGSHGIAVEFDGIGRRLTKGKIWGHYQTVAEFRMDRGDIEDAIKEFQWILEQMKANDE